MRKLFIGILIALISLTTNAQTIANSGSKATVKWYSIGEAQALNTTAPRKIFIDMFTTWCGWCKVLDKNTFSEPDIAQYLNTYFYPVKFDAEGKEPIVFNGHTFNFSPEQKSHELAIAMLQGKMSYPSMVFVDENLQLLTMLQGYLPPEDLRPILVFFAQEEYKKMTWQDFMAQWPGILKQ
ncbi:MAG: DUF255 domain-containing protein [Prevotellaceae bacterium]|jgi:thioredoxin-related protein|nr:DUF255 domain-containing protein [Prevotellaceae bacterium]